MSHVGSCISLESQKTGRTLLLLVLVSLAMAGISSAQTFRAIFSFNGTNGTNPNGPLVQGLDGSLYGTTHEGGAHNSGTVFKVTTAGQLTTLYSFCSQANCADGSYPGVGLLLGKDGNFYGTTWGGGKTDKGIAFKITPQGNFTTLYSFCACATGYHSVGALIQGTDGNLYGTTQLAGGAGYGAAFKMTTAGVVTVLHGFCSSNCSYGAKPNGLIQASDGNLYGTTLFGNSHDSGGTAFRLTTTGKLTNLATFLCDADSCLYGNSPSTSFVQASDGDLYSTTAFTATAPNATVFSMTLSGGLSVVYNSNLGPSEGPLIQATDGNFYATTVKGGTLNGGILFKLTPSGSLTVLHNFPSWRQDDPGVMQATDGSFYGTTYDSSTGNYGIIFKETTGLAPFVKSLPTSGAVGSAVTILGTNLTGATAVSFNGTTAKFSVVSATEINATVPTGATTGMVKVTTPRGTLSSNVSFAVP